MSLDAPEISLVVVCYEMARELPRTLQSLSTPYQRGVDPGQYEIVIVDNGSRSPPSLADFPDIVPRTTIISCSRKTTSPVPAINEGLTVARGKLIGVWIDGARMASPGLLRSCLEASRLHSRPIIATLNYQLGPARQAISADLGYDVAAEDALLSDIGWFENGYRLFDIATPEIAEPTAPMLESNALFLPRALWDELGGYDEAFTSKGGGMANPDIFIRAVGLPAAQLIRIAGEGTFHQIHGGLTTAGLKPTLDYVKEASREYRAIRGRALAPIRAPGWLYRSPEAER
ncbi:MAG: glycosyltransferase [Methylocystis sp.]|uniref:glycosyltransferase family 2 protein n=1 Tax=Methylocystis sp. TaxID=1911079 RepID=UPI003932B803